MENKLDSRTVGGFKIGRYWGFLVRDFEGGVFSSQWRVMAYWTEVCITKLIGLILITIKVIP